MSSFTNYLLLHVHVSWRKGLKLDSRDNWAAMKWNLSTRPSLDILLVIFQVYERDVLYFFTFSRRLPSVAYLFIYGDACVCVWIIIESKFTILSVCCLRFDCDVDHTTFRISAVAVFIVLSPQCYLLRRWLRNGEIFTNEPLEACFNEALAARL